MGVPCRPLHRLYAIKLDKDRGDLYLKTKANTYRRPRLTVLVPGQPRPYFGLDRMVYHSVPRRQTFCRPTGTKRSRLDNVLRNGRFLRRRFVLAVNDY